MKDWWAVLGATVARWKTRGGCEITREERSCVEGSHLFNYWGVDDNPIIEFEESPTDGKTHVVAERAVAAPIEFAYLPFLGRTAIKLRPSLFAFAVTGHVMLGIYYGMLPRPELHILNPWPLIANDKSEIQLQDLYALFGAKSPKMAGKIAYIDVAHELSMPDIYINLQEDERIGFCTLWVAIIADKVIPKLPLLTEAIQEEGAAAGSQLSMKTKDIYKKIYERLQSELAAGKEEVIAAYPNTGDDITNLAAAKAVIAMYKKALGKGGKRTLHRRTFRKRTLRWKSRRAHRSTLSTSQSRTRSKRRAGKGLSAY